MQGFSGFDYIASNLNFNESTFGRDKNVSLMDTVRYRFGNDSSANNTDMYFFGVFMAHFIERGFGMNKTSRNNWTLVFKTKVNFSSGTPP